MLTRTEAERLAASIHAIRDDWPISSIMTFLQRRKDRPLLPLALQLTYVAWDPDTTTPARIDSPGPWKRLGIDQRTEAEAPVYRPLAHDDCHDCGRPKDHHPTRDCAYTAPTHQPSAIPDDTRAAIRAALTTTQEEPK